MHLNTQWPFVARYPSGDAYAHRPISHLRRTCDISLSVAFSGELINNNRQSIIARFGRSARAMHACQAIFQISRKYGNAQVDALPSPPPFLRDRHSWQCSAGQGRASCCSVGVQDAISERHSMRLYEG